MKRLIIIAIVVLALGPVSGAQARHGEGGGDYGHEENGWQKPRKHRVSPPVAVPEPASAPVKSRPEHERRHDATRPAESERPQKARRQSAPEPRVPRHLERLGVRHMPAPLDRKQVLDADRDHSRIEFPKTGPQGRPWHFNAIERERINTPLVHEHLRAVVQDRVVLDDVRRFNTVEVVPDRYYWHRWRDSDYCHYYDRWGYHWYGWYFGTSFFWTRYYSGGWWCYDPVRFRWCWWYDGFWWWQDPSLNIVYVYDGSDYVARDQADPTPTPARPQATPLPAPPGEIPSLPSPPPGP